MKKAIIIGVACLTSGTGLAGCATSNSTIEKTITAETATTEAATAVETTTETTTTPTTTAETLSAKNQEEDEVLLKWLREKYNSATKIINGYPVIIENNESYNSYIKYALGDFDGDGGNEMITIENGDWRMDFIESDEDMVKGRFQMYYMYDLDSNKNVVERELSAGAMLSLNAYNSVLEEQAGIGETGYPDFKYTFYDNGVVKSEADANGKKVISYMIFDDKKYGELRNLNHKLVMWNDILGNGDTEAVVYIDDGTTIERYFGSHQDCDYGEISQSDYSSEIDVLTNGNVVDTGFIDITAENLGIEVSAEESVSQTETSVNSRQNVDLIDVTNGMHKGIVLEGTAVYYYSNINDANGKEEPFVGLVLDTPVQAKTETGKVIDVNEVQLGVGSDYNGYSLNDYDGEHIIVTGDAFGAHTDHHFKNIILSVNELEQ